MFPVRTFWMPGFFDAWPDWNHANVPQVKRERAFFFHVTYPGYAPRRTNSATVFANG
jgi:hypothetical protein